MESKEIKSRISSLKKKIKKMPDGTPRELAKINEIKLEISNLESLLEKE